MIRMLMTAVRVFTFAAIVLVLGQITVSNVRICDHVRSVTHSAAVQSPIRWIAQRFDFNSGYKGTPKAGSATTVSRAAGSGHANESDNDRLSGLLKR